MQGKEKICSEAGEGGKQALRRGAMAGAESSLSVRFCLPQTCSMVLPVWRGCAGTVAPGMVWPGQPGAAAACLAPRSAICPEQDMSPAKRSVGTLITWNPITQNPITQDPIAQSPISWEPITPAGLGHGVGSAAGPTTQALK